ncbi:MAG TPA: hypothetical protein VGA24_08035, partial [Steroidobacteraceae bacterium]
MRPYSRSLAAVVASVLAACNEESGATAAPEEIPFVPGQGSSEKLTDAQRDIARLAIDALAADLQIASDGILVDTIVAVDWRDSSIGCPKPGMAYLDVITPGHKITLRADGQIYTVHEAGNSAFVCRQTKAQGGITPQLDLVFGEQLVFARKDLASRIGVPESEITVGSAEENTWDDASLGCPEAGANYPPGPVTGWILTLKHGMRDYTYHTDLSRTIP